jgi:membrane protease YdiL (CAAX protease family)
MSLVRSLWHRLPVVVRAVLTGSLLATMGTVPWALLASANQKLWPSVPWAVPPTLLYLWLFWRYTGGAGWPRSTAEARRVNRRANELSGDVWAAALIAGTLGLVAVVLLLTVMGRLVLLPQQQPPDVRGVPVLTLFFLLLTSAAVAGIVEEASFRGYMQRPIELRHGPVVAILVMGMLFGLAHLTHREVTVTLLPYYMAAAAVYGALAFLTNSILPGVVLHAGGNVFLGFFDLLAQGPTGFEVPLSPAPLIWETGADAAFWVSLTFLLIVTAAAVWAFLMLASVAARPKAPGAHPSG